MICGYVLARMCSKRQYLGPQSTGINPLSSSLADIPTRSPFEGNLWLDSNATESTTALQFNTSQDIPESISYRTTQVVFEVCTRVENITDQETSIYCMTGLAIPACILVAVVISSMICGYVLARMCSKRQYLGP